MCRTDAHSFLWAALLWKAKSNRSKKSYLESQIWFRHDWAPARTLLQTSLFFNKWKMKYLFHLFLELSLAPNTCWMTQSPKRWQYHILRPEGRWSCRNYSLAIEIKHRKAWTTFPSKWTVCIILCGTCCSIKV